MIPLHFNSCRYNAYRKPGKARLLPTEKFVNSSPASPRLVARTGTPVYPERRLRGATRRAGMPATRIVSWAYFTTSVSNGGGGTSCTIRPGRTAHAPTFRPRASRTDSRYTTGAMLKTTVFDTNWMGRPRSIAAVLLESDGHRAILDPGPASTLPTLRQLLDARGIGVSDLNAILLTHIHLDHAGATGALIRENPNLEVYVHKAGLLHMADPTKLLASAERLWPGELQHQFGETRPVPFGNLRMLKGGETLSLGSRNLEVVHTPGHASHHVSYFDSSDGTAFVGDTTGFHIEGEPYVVPVAPPPDIDIEIWNASLNAIAERNPTRLFLTHFGYSNNPAEHIAEYRKNLQRWTALAAEILRSTPDQNAALEKFVFAATEEIKQRLSAAEAEHYVFNCGLSLNWLGLSRYHRKRAEAAANAANPL
jgi:glyoxylase-like metal-dependent hydrolase (beta-lactamase superfamily II)